MPFQDTIRALPFAGRTQLGQGFLPPMIRAMGHLLFLNACLADENVTVALPEAIEELTHAREHWNARTATEAVSTAARNRAETIGTAIEEAIQEFEGWDENTRINNIRSLNHRILQYAAELDRETVGIRDSDPGTSL